MASRAKKLLTIDLGSLTEAVENRVASGEFRSANEVVLEGLRALDREDARYTADLKRKIQEALDDPRPSIPQEQVFAELRARYEADT